MNKARRKAIAEILSKADDLRSELEAVRDDEQEAFDNLPESIQEGEQGSRMEEALDALDRALDTFAELESSLSEVE